MISLLLQVLNGLPPDVIANEELYFLESSGLHKSLSPTRANGLTSIVSKMKELALQAAEKSPS
jgi:cysteine desulfuration protein SufE